MLAWLDWVLIAAGSLLLLAIERESGGDGLTRYVATRSLVDGHVPHEKYSLVTPLLTVPLDVVGRLFGSEAGFAYRTNGVVFGLGLLAIWLLLRGKVPGTLIRAFLLILVFGSMFPAAVRSLYGETVTAVLLGVGLLAAIAGASRTTRLLGWAAAVLGVVNTPAIIPVFALVVVGLAVAKRSPWPLVAIGLSVALAVLDLRLHTGGFSSPYDDDHGHKTVLPFSGLPGFSYPALFGILGILFSLGKGLLFFSPGLFLPVRARLDAYTTLNRTRLVWIAVVAGMVLLYCRWWAWYGGIFYGPRFFLFASIPAALALAARLAADAGPPAAVAASVIALVLSLWVGVTSAMGIPQAPICSDGNYALEHLCWYTPEFSPLWRPLIDWPSLSPATTAYGLLALCVLLRLALPAMIATEHQLRAQLARFTRDVRHAQPW
jgi:hypothetical protein